MLSNVALSNGSLLIGDTILYRSNEVLLVLQ